LPILSAAETVITQQDLVSEDRGQQWGTVVIQAALPGTIIQLTQPFQPVFEQFARDVLSILADYGDCQEIRAKEIADVPAAIKHAPGPLLKQGLKS